MHAVHIFAREDDDGTVMSNLANVSKFEHNT